MAAPNGAGRGIGLNNVRRRLELLYPDKHALVVKDMEGTFSIELNLNLENNRSNSQ